MDNHLIIHAAIASSYSTNNVRGRQSAIRGNNASSAKKEAASMRQRLLPKHGPAV
jgi:hypothetical protein